MRVISSFVHRALRPRAGSHIGLLLTPFLVLVLAGCEQIAVLDGSKAIETEGKAVGGACRHAGRALEDCYAMNEKASKAAVFSGWREMNDYMTQNKIDTVPPVIARQSGNKGSGPAERKVEAPSDPSRPPTAGDKASSGNKPAHTAMLPREGAAGDHSGVPGTEGAAPRRPH